MMKLLNKKGYNPYNEESETGYLRPPKDAACVGDYFAALRTAEDGGGFLHAEVQTLMDDPEKFFEARKLDLEKMRDLAFKNALGRLNGMPEEAVRQMLAREIADHVVAGEPIYRASDLDLVMTRIDANTDKRLTALRDPLEPIPNPPGGLDELGRPVVRPK